MKQNEKLPLPIDPHIPEILNAVRDYSTIIVKASPGSGKTTRLPWAITSKLNLRVAVLEPRRLAARLAAQRIADEVHLVAGKEVGWHFRFEKNTSDLTRLTFYTEGTFLKRFLTDKFLNDLDVVILDEFHERHLDTDLALALLCDLQKKRKLKVILMSATLDLAITNQFQDAKIVEVEGINFPVELSYLPNQPSILNASLEQKVKKAVDETDGDTLIFLPGMREMLRVQSTLQGNYEVFLLHGELSKEEQNQALLPIEKRKIILATNIAESSVTIPGIRTVIDSGIQREVWFSPWNGLKFIKDSPVTKSSAIQRAGRAGRTGPGKCIRLYSQQDFNEREDHTIPEIERSDLTDVCLLVSGSGLTPVWPLAPDKTKWEKSLGLLVSMGALSEDGLITGTGKKMLEYPLDSRLSRVLVAGENLISSEKERLLNYIAEEIEKDRTGTLKKRLSFFIKKPGTEKGPWQKCLLSGFIDQMARYRPKQRDFIHYSGKTLKAHSSLDPEEGLYLIFDITQRQEAVDILEVHDEWVWDLDPFPFKEEDEIEISPKIQIKRKTKLGSIVVEENVLRQTWDQMSSETREKIISLTSSHKDQAIKAWLEGPEGERISFWARTKKIDPNQTLSKINVVEYFNECGNLNWDDFPGFIDRFIKSALEITDIERELPGKINLGGRRELIVHYPHNMDPYLEAPIQDFYGLSETPSLMKGQYPLTLKLLGPHKRPIQVTKDLKSFWHKTYHEFLKEYQREYPRHYWPERPWEAKPYLLKSHLPKA
jgi:ATP-dependent helicase HrpB